MNTPSRKTLVNLALMIELGPCFGDVLFAHNCVSETLHQMTLAGFPYSIRINPRPLRAGDDHRRVDIHIYDTIGSRHEPVATTGLMDEIAACTKAVNLLRQLMEARKADDAAWAQIYSDKGSYAEKMRRKFL